MALDNLTSGVVVAPQQNAALNSLQGVLASGQQIQERLIQMEEQKIKEFQSLVDVSLKDVYRSDTKLAVEKRKEYIDFVKNIYASSGRRPTSDQIFAIQDKRAELEDFINESKEWRKLYTDAYTKVTMDTSGKIDKEGSLAKLTEISSLPTPSERYAALTNGKWMALKEETWSGIEDIKLADKKLQADWTIRDGRVSLNPEESKRRIDVWLNDPLGQERLKLSGLSREAYKTHIFNLMQNESPPDKINTHEYSSSSKTEKVKLSSIGGKGTEWKYEKPIEITDPTELKQVDPTTGAPSKAVLGTNIGKAVIMERKKLSNGNVVYKVFIWRKDQEGKLNKSPDPTPYWIDPNSTRQQQNIDGKYDYVASVSPAYNYESVNTA